jgi:ABC-type glycerol-3-phosphate transport system substrate-binding protein
MHVQRLAVVLVALALALAGCGGDDGAEISQTTETTTTSDTTTTTETTPTPAVQTVRIVVENAAPKGGIVRKTVEKGDRVAVVVTSDVADEIHLHGYDLSRDVEAGGAARIRFTADVAGRFEVELEERGVQIADLTVEP